MDVKATSFAYWVVTKITLDTSFLYDKCMKSLSLQVTEDVDTLSKNKSDNTRKGCFELWPWAILILINLWIANVILRSRFVLFVVKSDSSKFKKQEQKGLGSEIWDLGSGIEIEKSFTKWMNHRCFFEFWIN